MVGLTQDVALEIAQGFNTVTLEVDLAFVNGYIAQLGSRFDVEHEEQAVNEAQAFERELLGVERILAGVETLALRGGELAELIGGFVAEQLDGGTQGVLEVFGNAKGMLVGVFVQPFKQASGARCGREAIVMQQGSGGLQGGAVFAVENFAPVKTQHAIVGPFEAISLQPLDE